MPYRADVALNIQSFVFNNQPFLPIARKYANDADFEEKMMTINLTKTDHTRHLAAPHHFYSATTWSRRGASSLPSRGMAPRPALENAMPRRQSRSGSRFRQPPRRAAGVAFSALYAQWHGLRTRCHVAVTCDISVSAAVDTFGISGAWGQHICLPAAFIAHVTPSLACWSRRSRAAATA